MTKTAPHMVTIRVLHALKDAVIQFPNEHALLLRGHILDRLPTTSEDTSGSHEK